MTGSCHCKATTNQVSVHVLQQGLNFRFSSSSSSITAPVYQRQVYLRSRVLCRKHSGKAGGLPEPILQVTLPRSLVHPQSAALSWPAVLPASAARRKRPLKLRFMRSSCSGINGWLKCSRALLGWLKQAQVFASPCLLAASTNGSQGIGRPVDESTRVRRPAVNRVNRSGAVATPLMSQQTSRIQPAARLDCGDRPSRALAQVRLRLQAGCSV